MLGLFLSLAHNHFVDATVDSDIEIHVTKDTNECAVCASHFKVTPSTDLELNPLLRHWDSPSVDIVSAIFSPVFTIHDDRAPPVVVPV